jgi:putative Mn2+ efflux pump MntP
MELSIAEIALVAVALGCDAFAVGMGVGTRYHESRQVFRLSFHFGLFQFLMPVIGWILGSRLVDLIRFWGPFIASGLLVVIGVHMIVESLKGDHDETKRSDPTRGVSLLVLSLATSIDALGVGFSLGMLGGAIFAAAVWIGLTASAMTWAAMKLGRRLSQRFGRRMGVVGGIILIVIAVRFLFV